MLDVLIAAGSNVASVRWGRARTRHHLGFASHRTHSQFISMPTTPSVDGFASIGAPLIVHGVKIPVICQAPLTFADINTLANQHAASHHGAGFADMLGKLTSIASWRIGRLLWNEPYDNDSRSAHSTSSADLRQSSASAMGQGTAGISRLLDALLESGSCMLDFGSSRAKPRAPSIIIRTTGR